MYGSFLRMSKKKTNMAFIHIQFPKKVISKLKMQQAFYNLLTYESKTNGKTSILKAGKSLAHPYLQTKYRADHLQSYYSTYTITILSYQKRQDSQHKRLIGECCRASVASILLLKFVSQPLQYTINSEMFYLVTRKIVST